MKRLLIMIGLTAAILTGCQKQDVVKDTPSPEPAKTYVLANLALSLPTSPSGTRMLQGVTEGGSGSGFRGISQLSIIPFAKRGVIEKTDKPSIIEISNSTNTFYPISDNEHYRYYEKVFLNHGVASFLTYGQGSKTSPARPEGVSDKVFFGSLIPKVAGVVQTSVPDKVNMTAGDLSFELETIYNEKDANDRLIVPDEATAIAAYLSYIADAKVIVNDKESDWKSAVNPNLLLLYKSFINDMGGGKYGLIAGSAANTKAYVNHYYEQLGGLMAGIPDYADAYKIAIEVRRRIREYSGVTFDNTTKMVTSLGICDNYPSDKDLPDGAAALQWAKKSDNTYGFVPQIQTTTMANVSSMNRYTYPAELYYYGNSLIKTSNTEVPEAAYSGKESWAGIVNDLYTSGTVISTNTKAVAIVDPMQYAVARVQGKVQAESSTGSLPDADGLSVPLNNGEQNSFKITGMIISKQYPVNFDFTPKHDGASEDNEHFVYDSYLSSSPMYLTTEETSDFYTMVLQSHDNDDVMVIMEFENNSGVDFQGENGIVYNGTKFYLAGKVKVSAGDKTNVDSDAQKRVFTQDHTTIIGMKVNSLKKAYNVMPNIQSGRLEVGIEINLKWEQSTPQTIVFGDE